MQDFNYFEAPNTGEVTVCEIDGKIQSMSYDCANVAAFTTTVSNHPQIRITRNMLQHHLTGDEVKRLFLPVDQPFLKRLVQTYLEQGFLDGLHLVSESGPFLIKNIASFFVKAIESYSSFKKSLWLNPTDSLRLIEECSLSKFRSSYPIRCISWHGYCSKIAVASIDDCVRIYSTSSSIVPQLKCREQKNITCIAWRPLSNSEIAVGCENGIIVWDVDPISVATKLSSINNAVILHRVEHSPVVSIAWSWRGDLLASSAGCDSTILIWNVELKETSSLKRPGGGGNSLVKWSPVGSRLFSATTGIVFRVWQCCTWESERWTLPGGRVQSACWSPCGSIVLFSTSEEPIIYALTFMRGELIFASNSKDSANVAIPVYDVSKRDMAGVTVGGIIQNMEWDSTGNNLAVLFKETDYIALFKITFKPVLEIHSSGFITGLPEEKPIDIEFQNNFEDGACLSIAWSSGRIQHFPIVYVETPLPSVNDKSYFESSFTFNNSYKLPNMSFY